MIQIKDSSNAPELHTAAWFNAPQPFTMASLEGRVVVIHAFQMLCPGCISHGLPQAVKIHQMFAQQPLQVIGLHAVFEHHEVMTIEALKVFIGEYKINFPVAVDAPAIAGPIPQTMSAYQLAGTPSLILVDKQGRVRLNHFGHLDDMQVGRFIGTLLTENAVR